MYKLTSISLTIFFLSAIGVGLPPSKSDIQKKIIRQGSFDIEFFVSLKDSHSFDLDKTYFWYKSGEIHQSVSGSGGLLLHSEFKKHYRSNQLAETGTFNYGLKHGIWKKWNENGKIKLIEEWKKGQRNGIYIGFDSIGNRLYKGYYKNNYKSGDWIDYKKKDTISYNKGDIKVDDPNKKESFFKRLFKKKDSINNSEDSKRNKKTKLKNNTTKKEGFFKHLFKKKNKKKPAKKTLIKP